MEYSIRSKYLFNAQLKSCFFSMHKKKHFMLHFIWGSVFEIKTFNIN